MSCASQAKGSRVGGNDPPFGGVTVVAAWIGFAAASGPAYAGMTSWFCLTLYCETSIASQRLRILSTVLPSKITYASTVRTEQQAVRWEACHLRTH